MIMKDLSFDFDIRGDYALFIEESHFLKDGWNLDDYVRLRFLNCEPTFFRVIRNGEQLHNHGWLEDGKVVQWG
jgi:hypothetical protein